MDQRTNFQISTFNCSLAHPELAGNFKSYVHSTRLEDWHRGLPTKPPFSNRQSHFLKPMNETLDVAMNVTVEDANRIFRNPYTWGNQPALAEIEDQSWIWKLDRDNIAFKWNSGRTYFIRACRSTSISP